MIAEMPPQLSVIICSHNPRVDYLQRVLAALKLQTLPIQQWELLLVDNASRERLSDGWDLSWHPHGRHVREDTLGLTPARLRGIREARANLLIFVDDDNVMADDYLVNAAAIAERHACLGVFGAGLLEPEFEIQPSLDLQPFLPLLALRSVASARWSNQVADTTSFPWGAGLCARRATALAFAALVERFNATSALGRRGEQLFCAEDDLFSWAAARIGLGFGIFPELRITHLISSARVSHAYFIRLIQAHSFSHGILRFVLSGIAPPHEHLFSIARLLLHGARRGVFSMRCRRAAAKGEADARRFIENNRLRPMTSRLIGHDDAGERQPVAAIRLD